MFFKILLAVLAQADTKRWVIKDNQIKILTLKIRQSTIYYAGLLGRWEKRIIDQESDVSSIFFLYFLHCVANV